MVKLACYFLETMAGEGVKELTGKEEDGRRQRQLTQVTHGVKTADNNVVRLVQAHTQDTVHILYLNTITEWIGNAS